MPLYQSAATANFLASDHNLAGWNYDPSSIQAGTILGVAGTLYLSKAKVTSPLITNVLVHLGGAGATLTAGQCFAALFSSTGTLLSTTADQAANWQSSGLKTMALSAAQTVPIGYVYVGFFANGTTLPSMSRSGNLSSPLINVGLSTPNLKYSSADAGLTTAMPATFGAQTGSQITYWVGLS